MANRPWIECTECNAGRVDFASNVDRVGTILSTKFDQSSGRAEEDFGLLDLRCNRAGAFETIITGSDPICPRSPKSSTDCWSPGATLLDVRHEGLQNQLPAWRVSVHPVLEQRSLAIFCPLQLKNQALNRHIS